MIEAIILSILVISSSPAFLDLKNTFLAAARNFKSSIISTHLIVRLSIPPTTGAATGTATGATAGAAATGLDSVLIPSNLSPSIIFSYFSFFFFK